MKLRVYSNVYFKCAVIRSIIM